MSGRKGRSRKPLRSLDCRGFESLSLRITKESFAMVPSKIPTPLPKWMIYLFFFIGVLSALSIRVLIVFQHLNPAYVRLFWYIGTLGYFIFFMYRYFISNKRKRAVRNFDLIRKIEGGGELSIDERRVVGYLLKSIDNSLENYNYMVIFLSTAVAIVVDLLLAYHGF